MLLTDDTFGAVLLKSDTRKQDPVTRKYTMIMQKAARRHLVAMIRCDDFPRGVFVVTATVDYRQK